MCPTSYVHCSFNLHNSHMQQVYTHDIHFVNRSTITAEVNIRARHILIYQLLQLSVY